MKLVEIPVKAPQRNGSIHRKLLAGYIGLTLLIVLLTAVVSFFLVRNYIMTSNQGDLLRMAETIADMAARPGGNTRVLTSGRLSELQEISDARLIHIDGDMNVLPAPSTQWANYDSDYGDFEISDVIDPLDTQLWTQLRAGKSVSGARYLQIIDGDVVFAVAPIVVEYDERENAGAILMYRPLQQISQTIGQIVLMLSLAGLFALAVAIGLAFFMGRRMSRPLVQMSSTAKHIAEGNYGAQIDVHQNDEVGQLGDTLNLLSARLAMVIQNLSEEKSKLEEVLESIGEGIIAIDREGLLVHRNPAALSLIGDRGQSDGKDDPLTRHLLSMLGESMAQKTREAITFSVPGGRTIEAISSPILTEDGAAIGAVCLLRDISEAQRLEQMRRDYIANISHELRTPLTGIRGMVEPLIDGIVDTESEKQDCYLIIHTEALRLERLIGEMLDLSRLQDGRAEMELASMGALPLLEAAARKVRNRAQSCGVQIAVSGEADLTVLGNEDRIMQILMILLDNALSFTPQGGEITLSAEAQGDSTCLFVKDSGAGIDPMDLPYIWERFFKADRSRLRTKGVGLGLAIAKLVVELMGGAIEVQSQPGQGTTFTIALPKGE